jgi:SH3 domain-containing YSC84-like protein 1
MKKLVCWLLLLSFVSGGMAGEPAHLEQKARKLLAKFDAMQRKPGKGIPPEILSKAHGIILLDRTKAGFVFAYQGGGGIGMARDKGGNWGPIAFMKANEASLGFQVGGQQSFLVLLFMTEQSAKQMGMSSMEFGGEARGTAGDRSAGEEGVVKTEELSLMVYDDRQGLFGGAAIKGGALDPDQEANAGFYGKYLTAEEILFGKKVKPTPVAIDLAGKIKEYSQKK